MDDDTGLLFDLPSVARKKVSAAFDGGRITSDGGVALLALADRRIGIIDRIAGLIADPRDPALVTHSVASILRARVLAIACGYEDANDLDRLRGDPAFKLACGRLPDSGGELCSQPTISRWENAPDLKTIVRLTYAMVDAWCASYAHEPGAVTLDIDDTWTWFTAPSSCRCSMLTTMNAASCRSTSTTPPPASRRGDPSPGQDTFGQGGGRLSAPALSPHPSPLAGDAPDDPRGRSLWPARAHGLLREARPVNAARNFPKCRSKFPQFGRSGHGGESGVFRWPATRPGSGCDARRRDVGL